MDLGVVYSTAHGRMCPGCNKPVSACICKATMSVAKGDGIARICRETKGRKGKTMTIISGLGLHQNQLEALAKKFKQQCGTGGTVKNSCIEIQGDHRDALFKALETLGYVVKKSGG